VRRVHTAPLTTTAIDCRGPGGGQHRPPNAVSNTWYDHTSPRGPQPAGARQNRPTASNSMQPSDQCSNYVLLTSGKPDNQIGVLNNTIQSVLRAHKRREGIRRAGIHATVRCVGARIHVTSLQA